MNIHKTRHPDIRRRTYLLTTVLCGAGLFGILLLAVTNMTSHSETEIHRQENAFTNQPTWSQDFTNMSDSQIDTAVWRYETDYQVPGYNDEAQAYTSQRKNVRIEPATGLVLEAHKEQYTYPDDPSRHTYNYTSGRIDTKHAFDFEYGKIEARIKLPRGAGAWPAFWLLSASEPHTNSTPSASNDQRDYMKNGEIDIMEHYGSTPSVIEGTVHTYAQSNAGDVIISNASDTFHTYGVEVTPNNITWLIDGNPFHSFDKPSENANDWPFGNGNRLYIILNLALGGSGGGEIRAEHGPWKMEVQSVSYYPYLPQH